MEIAKLKNYNKENNTRKCKKCNTWKDLSLFSSRTTKKRKAIQVREVCKACSIKSVDKHSKYRTSSYRKGLYRKDPRINLLYSANCRAKLRGLDYNLTVEDLVVPDVCPLLEIPLFIGDKLLTPNSPTIDRIDSTKGYVKGNVWIISHRANTIKSNATLKELRTLTKNLGSCIKRMNCKNAEMPTCSQAIDTSIEGSETTGEVKPS